MMAKPGEQEKFQAALVSMQTGQFGTAVALCQEFISEYNANGDILHVLALSHRGLGQKPLAEQAIKRAAKKSPTNPTVRNSYGLIMLDAGDALQASLQFKRAIKLDEHMAAAHANLGHALKQSGKLINAKRSYLEALRIDPSLTDAFVNLSLLLNSMGEIPESEDVLGQFLAKNPRSPASEFVEGTIALAKSDLSGAEKCFRRGIDLEPQSRPILVNLGITLTKQGRLIEATEILERALGLFPEDPDILINLANALKYTAPAKARAYVEGALQQHPNDTNSIDLLGFCYLLEKNTDHAIEAFDRALLLDPTYQRALHHKACALFLKGRLGDAWPYYLNWYGESGIDGSPIDKALERATDHELLTIPTLIWTDQGIGDEILQLSMVADLAENASPISLATSTRLTPLAARSFPGIQCVNQDQISGGDTSVLKSLRQFPAGALGSLVRPDLESFPNRRAFLKANEQVSSDLRQKYRAHSQKNPVVGLSWKSANTEFGQQKSIQLDALLPLLIQPQFTFVDLQYGSTGEDIGRLPIEIQNRIIQDTEIDPLIDLDQFAAQIMAVDLVITTSNSTAHLAGALGQETWILVPRPGPGWLWYWFMDRRDSPWYPSTTIFRQDEEGNWSSAIQKIAGQMGQFLSV